MHSVTPEDLSSFKLDEIASYLSWLILFKSNPSLNQECSFSVIIETLFWASFSRHKLINYLPLALTFTLSSNLWGRLMTALIIPGIPTPSDLVGKKGGRLYNIMKVNTPSDHTSHLDVYFSLLRIYGAIDMGVPQKVVYPSSESLENPKSANLSW